MNEEEFTKKVANTLMLGMAKGVSESLSKFATWLLAGFSAAFTLILANLDNVTKFIQVNAIKEAVFLFLISLVIAVVQRWIFTIIQAGSLGSDEGMKIDSGLNQAGLAINKEVLLKEIEDASFYPAKYYIKKQYDKIRGGDHTVGGRQQIKLAQIQGFLMLAQVLMAVLSLVVFVNGIKV